ncbi:MAG: type II secretion system GspH family protein [Ruminococcus sp.]|nr:type II secretion system GspH family protein [Ruminococcus sp.]
MRSHKGFTLVELVVVIAIIGVLAAILVPSMLTYVKKARLKTANGNAKTAFNAVSAFFIEKETQGENRTKLINDYCDKDVDCRIPPAITMDALQLEIHDTLEQNGIDSGIVYVGSTTISSGVKDIYFVHWTKNTFVAGGDNIVGQYPRPVTWNYLKKNGCKWNTYMK